MRIYRDDGTFVESPEDTEFGWYFGEITIDEAVSDYETRNKETYGAAVLRKFYKRSNLEESVTLSGEFEESQPVLIEHYEPKIGEYVAESVLDTKLDPEGPAVTKESNKLENIDEKIPSKQQVASLINPCCSVESKMLLSVVHFAKYKQVIGDKDVVHLGELRNNSKLKFLLNDKAEKDDLHTEIRNYHETKEDSMLSLMMELILADMKCDMDDVTNSPRPPNNTSDLGSSVKSGEISDEEKEERGFSLITLEGSCRSDAYSSLGLNDAVDRSMEKICEETYDIHLQIEQIKKSFEVYERRLDALIAEAKDLGKNLRATQYLEELVHLLKGDLHKVTPKKWPFRILLHPSDTKDINLIV